MSQIQLILIITIAVIVAVIALYIFLRKRKISHSYEVFSKLQIDINTIEEKVVSELARTKKILKNDENTELYNSWIDDHSKLLETKNDFERLFNDLTEAKKITRYKEFMDVYAELEIISFEFSKKYDALYKRVHKFTKFEQSNNTISVQLKSRLKEEQNRYDSNLGHLKIYDESFNEQVKIVTETLKEFESLEREGLYIQARNILKDCNDVTQELERTNKLITVFQNNFIAIRANIKNLITTKTEIEKLGYQIDVEDFDEIVRLFNKRLDECVEPTALFTFGAHIDEATSGPLINNLSELDDDIKQLIPKLQTCFENINHIISLREANDVAIEQLATLASGALEERDVIAKFYDISKLKEIQSLDQEIARLKKFIEDYKKLEDLIHDVAEPYVGLLERLEKSQKYLTRMIAKFKETIKTLENVRNDEIKAQDALPEYRRAIVNIDLYLRKNNHILSMSPTLLSLCKDVKIKYAQLEDELGKEPLAIENVNNLNDSIIKLLDEIINEKLVKDVKQKHGCFYILHYIAKFTENEDIESTYRRFEMLFQTHQYTLFLKEATAFLHSHDKNGATIYKELVSIVDVEDFSEVV